MIIKKNKNKTKTKTKKQSMQKKPQPRFLARTLLNCIHHDTI